MMSGFAKFLEVLIYWLIVIIPFSIVIAPAVMHSLMVLLYFSFILNKVITKERPLVRTPVNKAYLVFLFSGVLSFINTVSFPDSMHGLVRMLLYGLFFLICAEKIKDKKHIERIFIFIAAGATLASSDAIWQLLTGADFIRGRKFILNIGLNRATASFPNANVFGVYMSAISPLIIALTFFYFKGKSKVLMTLLSGLAVFGIISTFSRGTALGFFCGVLFISLVLRKKLIAFLLVLLLFISPFILPSQIKRWAKGINYNPVVFMFNADRISMYRNSINMIKHHPVFGLGLNTYCRNYSTYKLPEPKGAETADNVYAHNNFMQLTAETGFVGLFAFLYFLYLLFKQAIKTFNSFTDNYYKILSAAVTGCLFSFLINGMTETSLYYSRVTIIFWFMVGFSLSLRKFTNAD